MTIQSYARGLSGVRAANPDVKLRLDRDAARPGEAVLIVEYPKPTDDPAGRDVWCDAENTDWTIGNALSLQIKPTKTERLSVSFLDGNRVAYTTWIDLQGGVWQPVRIAFADIRPNPYFQPPDARIGAPLDLHEIKGLAFAPHNQEPGQFAVSRFILTQ